MEFTGERYVPNSPDKRDELSVEHLHRYHSILPLTKGKIVVDIACGEGYGSALIAKQAREVIGIDISEECILHASTKYNTSGYPNLFFKTGDIANIPLDDKTVDVIVSFETIEHVSAEAQKSFLAEAKRVLKEDGLFIISTPDKENYSDRYEHLNHFHVHELDREEFKQLLSAYFKITQILEQGFEIVSTISPSDYSNVDNIRLINWHKKVEPRKRKYLIAIASDKTITQEQLSSIVLETDKDYFKQIDRIIELQNEVEKLGKWGQGLDRDRIDHEATIKTLNDKLQFFQGKHMTDLNLKLEDLQKWLFDQSRIKQAQIELLVTEAEEYKATINSKEQEMQALQDKNNTLEQNLAAIEQVYANNEKLENQLTTLADELREKEKTLHDLQFNSSLIKQQLNEVNNKLVTIYDSDGWKFLNRYYNLKGRYLNENSAHYKALRKIFNFFRKRKNTYPDNSSNISKTESPANIAIATRTESGEIIKRTLPYFEKPEVSIIIPVYNAWEMNIKCLAAIIENTADVTYEVIIADDCSTDDTKNITEYFLNLVHVRNEKNMGFLLNCNNAATHAKGKYLHFLNNDTEVKPGWLSSLVLLMNKDETIGLAGSKLIYPDGRLQEAGGIIWEDASGWNYGHRQNPDLPEFNYVKEVDYISGASIMIRKDLWQKIGGFDERYVPAYFEDTDIAFEIRKLGFRTVYQPLSVVTHYEGVSHGTHVNSGIKKFQKLNAEKFLAKWSSVLSSEHFKNAQHVFHARDKSQHKKTILVIDHYVPHFDKDAGSRHTFQYLQLMVDIGMNVKFIGDNFFKHEPYTTILQQMGVEVLYGEYYKNNWQPWLLENQNSIGTIYLHRPHIAIKYIDFIRSNIDCKVIYFGHDLHYYREEKQYEIEKNPALLDSAKEWKRIEVSLFEKSDLILTPSEKEREIIASLSQSFNVTTIPLFCYDKQNDPVSDFSARRDIMFIGGFNHAPNKDAVLWFISEIWPLIKENAPGIKFIIAGSNVPMEIISINDPDVIVKGYVSDEELKNLYKQIRIIVIPLRYGAGIKGKTLEALYNGIPIVSTPEGIEGLPGDHSFLTLAGTSQLFAEKLVELYKNEGALIENSKNSIQYISDFFTKKIAKETISKEFCN